MSDKVRDLMVEDVARGLKEGRVVLVDVREPNETAVERFPGAVLVPLSSFDPATIPAPPGAEVVFACRSGRRSVTASLASQEQGFAEIVADAAWRKIGCSLRSSSTGPFSAPTITVAMQAPSLRRTALT